jgi:hypothetical protein
LVVLIVFVTGLVMLLTKGKDIKDSLVQLPFASGEAYYPVGTGVVYIRNGLLTCVDAGGKDVWKVQLDSADLKYASNGTIIAAYGADSMIVMGSKGESLLYECVHHHRPPHLRRAEGEAQDRRLAHRHVHHPVRPEFLQ